MIIPQFVFNKLLQNVEELNGQERKVYQVSPISAKEFKPIQSNQAGTEFFSTCSGKKLVKRSINNIPTIQHTI